MSNTSPLSSALSATRPFILDSVPAFLATVLFTILLTRFLSGLSANAAAPDGDAARKVRRVPYYFPVLGHIFEFFFGTEAFLNGLRYDELTSMLPFEQPQPGAVLTEAERRTTYTHGIFALILLGSTHNIAFSPSLIDNVLAQDDAVLGRTAFAWVIFKNAFQLPAKLKNDILQVHNELQRLLSEHLEGPRSRNTTVSSILQNLREHLPNLVTFNSSLVDQTTWERVSNTQLVGQTDGEAVVETSLLTLIHDILNAAILPSILGPSFLENFSYPDFTADLQTLSSSFYLLASGLPRWVPLPGLVPAHLARRRLLGALTNFYHSIDSDPDPDSDSGDEQLPSLLRTMDKTYAAHNLLPSARASLTLSLLWTLSAQIHTLSFWLLLRILSTPDLVARVRAETTPYARATQPPNEFGIPEPPRLEIGVEGLRAKCPLLRSCYVETVRLDGRVWSVGKARRDFVVQESEEDAVGGKPQRWGIGRGTDGVDAGEACQACGRRWGLGEVEWGSVKGFEDGSGLWRIESFTEEIVLAFVAGVLALWEIEPASWRGWTIPGKHQGFMVPMPNSDVRVRIRRRSLQQSGNRIE
ncbi:hypothetical protein H2199_004428 [Coniosporium tulheliwenetii]|uniref:Uncharacterized protein n=1 Tax=Coniosporium tulheliwenetii TaxID=3383036 RepID=A0ACC2Z6H7_9PEZI|nr:hypothetical protein H2199_004428 [Cladosporium sp. JES 115]